MGPFLLQNGTVARFGLSGFPDADPADSSTVCRTGRVVQDIPDVANDDPTLLQDAATQVNNTIQAIGTTGLPAAGGTPTAATLTLLGSQPSLQDTKRKNIVLLLTDGLPNCNGSLDKSTCTCVTGATPCPSQLNCLDDTAAINAVTALAQKNIATIVIGFGADTGASLGRPTLNNMAVAGGYQRECTTSSDCGTGDTCSGGHCSVIKFYQAANGVQLAAVLAKLQQIIDVNPCGPYKFSALDKPSDPRFLVVYVDGQKQLSGPDTWQYSEVSGEPQVDFVGQTCTRLENSDATHPIDVQIQMLQTM